AFLTRCVIRGDYTWTSHWWIKSVFFFWLAMLLSALFSPTPTMAAIEAVIWIRFPLLAFAFAFWLAYYPALVRLLLMMTGIGLLLMMAILSAELYVTYDQWSATGGMSARLSWPYGDPVSGNYLAKFGLVAAVWAAAGLSSPRIKSAFLGGVAAGLLLLFTVLTGERINALLVFCTLSLTLVWLNYHRKKILALFLSALALIGLFAISRSDFLIKKFTSSFFEGLSDFNNSGYIQLWQTGLEMFKTAHLTGTGAGMFRFLCDQTIYAEAFIPRCDNHPHNYYIQVLAETGLFGFVTFVIMVTSLTYIIWANARHSSNLLKKSCFIVPLALFFPLQSTGDVFGQWVNSMMWFAVSLAMAISLTEEYEDSSQSVQ
ncbi:MAG: O-antigen ligase family protein, partial [Candidatus Puniceispirillaceae bacterium]